MLPLGLTVVTVILSQRTQVVKDVRQHRTAIAATLKVHNLYLCSLAIKVITLLSLSLAAACKTLLSLLLSRSAPHPLKPLSYCTTTLLLPLCSCARITR
jgi:hypothetical protein